MQGAGSLRMRYHIDTIPVWDALKHGAGCPLCALRRKTERRLVERALGASVMSPDSRIKVNRTGFCRTHQQMLYNAPGGNRLGHALMMLSYLQETRSRLPRLLDTGVPGGKPAGLFRKGKDASGGLRSPADSAGCVLCEELDEQSRRHAASFLHLWKTDAAFQAAYQPSVGVCLPDAQTLLLLAPDFLSAREQAGFRGLLESQLAAAFQALESDLSRFTQKSDYRNTELPWGDAKDALERTVNHLRGWCLGKEPLKDER